MIQSALLSASGIKRPPYASSNPAPGKRPNIAPNFAIAPAPGYITNHFTTGDLRSVDKPTEVLTTSRFDDEFGDDFYGTNLDHIVALTETALKNSSFPSLAPDSDVITSNSSNFPEKPPVRILGSVPKVQNNSVNPIPSTLPSSAIANGQCTVSTSSCAVVNQNMSAYGFQNPTRWEQFPTPVEPMALNNHITHASNSMEPESFNIRSKTPSRSNDQTLSTMGITTVQASTPTQQVSSTNDTKSSSPTFSKDNIQHRSVSIEEYNRLRVMFNECSQERGRLRLQQKQLQAQIATKTGGLTMLRSKLNSLEIQLNKTRAEMAQRVAVKNDAHKAQYARMKSQIDTLNLERESLERELEEIGRTNESLTRALSNERQVVQALRRQISLTDANQTHCPISPEKDVPVGSSFAKTASVIPNSNASHKSNNMRNFSFQHKAFDHTIPKVVSSSLEDGLLELVRCPDVVVLHESLGMDFENQICLLINGSYPVFYAFPILKPILDCGKNSVLAPVLRVLHVLVTFDTRSRQIILGSVCSPGALATEYRLQQLPPNLVPCPVWTKSGTYIGLSKAGLERLDVSNQSFKNFYRADTEPVHSDSIECPGIINSLVSILKNRSDGDNEVVTLCLSIFLELLRHAQSHQVPKFNCLLDTGLLQSLFLSMKELESRTRILLIFTHLLWCEDNLKWFTMSSPQPSALQCVFVAMEFRPDSQTYIQTTTLHLAAMDILGFILGKFGLRGVNALLYSSANSQQSRQQEQQIFPKLSSVMIAELDAPKIITERSRVIHKGMSIIETLLPYVNVFLQTSGFRFQILSLLTRIIQLSDDLTADQASAIRLRLIEAGCLDLLSKPDQRKDSAAFCT